VTPSVPRIQRPVIASAVLWPQIKPAGSAVAELAIDMAPYAAEDHGGLQHASELLAAC
jgi:hypothetical protein